MTDKEDLDGLKQAFALFDRDRDGEINQENFQYFCARKAIFSHSIGLSTLS